MAYERVECSDFHQGYPWFPIRTVFAKGEQAYVQTCGGNVYDSNPEDEYEEIVRKFAGTKKVLDLFM